MKTGTGKNIGFPEQCAMIAENRNSCETAKLYIPSTPNNSNETHTFMCLGRTGRFGQR